jgi:hypothetical protein
MNRTGMYSLSSLAAIGCLALTSCMDEAQKQHAQAAKAIDAVAIKLEMLSPDVNAAAQEAQSALHTLRSIDVQSGPLSSVRSALSAKAQLVLGEASVNASRAARRNVASLSGRIEARMLSLHRLRTFSENAPFTPRQLGVDALDQGLDDRSSMQAQYEQQIDMLQRQIDSLQSEHDQYADHIANARQDAHAQRSSALHEGTSESIGDIQEAAQSLEAVAPLETKVELLSMDIAILQDQQRQLDLLIDGESDTITAIKTESADLRGFISARSGQIDDVRERMRTLQGDLETDATALAIAETGPLLEHATAAIEHFNAAANEAQRAARQAGRNGMADRVLELTARQSALTMATSRFMSLNRNAALLERLASQGDMRDGAALREQARALGAQRDDAMEQARNAAQAAVDVAEQLDDGITAEAIRSKLGSMQDLLNGKVITVANVATPSLPPTPVMPTEGSDDSAAPAEAIAVATAFLKDGVLAGAGDQEAADNAKAMVNCDSTPEICSAIELSAKALPALASLNELASTTFTGPEAMGISQMQAMLDPAMIKGMIAPMLSMVASTNSSMNGNVASVQFQLGPGNGITINLLQDNGTWVVSGGEMPFTNAAHLAQGKAMLEQIESVRTQLESGEMSSAMDYLQKAQDLSAAMQAMGGIGQ